MNILVVGATGTLGRQIVKEALENGYAVKCLVRNFRKATFLKEWGAELVYGDLTKVETIPLALKDINVIIDASVTRTLSEYTSEIVDWKGKIALIEAAKKAKIGKFVFFSFLNKGKNNQIPLLDLKSNMEQYLAQSGLDYTIFRLGGFFQGLIEQYAIPVLEKQPIITSKELSTTSYINTQDAAKYILETIFHFDSKKKVFLLFGPKNWSTKEVIENCESLCGERAQTIELSNTAIQLARKFLDLFSVGWIISDRLAFVNVSNKINYTFENSNEKPIVLQYTDQSLKLEDYFKEYFAKILKRLQELNYTKEQKRKDLTF